MSSPHDHFIKGFLSSPPEARDFLETYLPASVTGLLQLENLELTKESFIGTQHEESRTDLLYKIPLNRGSNVFVYLLFEHKSYYDPNIFFQLLEYLSKIYTWQNQNNDSLRIVIPFVFYHGEKEWNLGQFFLDSFPKDTISEELLKFIPNFSIQLMELCRHFLRYRHCNTFWYWARFIPVWEKESFLLWQGWLRL